MEENIYIQGNTAILRRKTCYKNLRENQGCCIRGLAVGRKMGRRKGLLPWEGKQGADDGSGFGFEREKVFIFIFSFLVREKMKIILYIYPIYIILYFISKLS